MTDVRVRFCPSPTGTPHVGLIRTALFNWAYARHTGGTFVFRIEDTDAARDSEESYEQLLDAMRWLGLDWDEGVEVGGPHGPYRQSQRLDIYADVAQKLLEGGYAYESFSTPEEVEERHRAAGRDPKLGYDGFDRNLSELQKAEYRAEGRQPVLRMRMPDDDVTFVDAVRGEITFSPGSIPDFVIVRGNGQPLYTLTNPVDDALMDITHVLRGEDLLSSTPRQVVLHRALVELGIAKQIPTFGHLPYVMGEGNKKLSKRDPQSNLFLHREKGMIPEGLVNYLALLGWSIAPDNDIFTIDEMVEAFDIADVNPNPARFDEKKAIAINAEHIRRLDTDDFVRRIVPFLGDAVSASSFDELTPMEQRILRGAAPLAQTRIQTLSDTLPLVHFLFVRAHEINYDPKALAKFRESAPQVLAMAIKHLSELDDFTAESIKETMSTAVIETLGLKPRVAFAPLFVAVSGSNVSLPVFDSMELIGREKTIEHLQQLSDFLKRQPDSES
ncbi:glutamate--tRNA ligase [Flaviflexus huanghaiensis]|uniref:glutamate--tRNA ligase n=1 Tax=Flaviflexus huanghaiensis TaxID=1111473 RepID=UPI0015F8C739|nr:glutamate--tRNA ligase [Flaviflexus huanghaiensis]